MRIDAHICGSVLPTVMVVSVLMLVGMLGLISLWEQERLLFARSCRLRQARADLESAYTLYRLYPNRDELFASEGYQLRDSLTQSRVCISASAWGLYQIVSVTTQDSLVQSHRLYGAEPDTLQTLYYVDNRAALTLAGQTILQGQLHVPQKGIIYGRLSSDFYLGSEIPHHAIKQSRSELPSPSLAAQKYISRLFVNRERHAEPYFVDSISQPFRDSTAILRLGDAKLHDCTLLGRVVLYVDELHIDASCRIENMLICARKITVASGARISVQLFARDTIIIEHGVELEYPSGIYSQTYADVGADSKINGYVIVRDTIERKKPLANYRQARTARVRGLVWIDGVAQLQGIISGQVFVQQAAYFSPQGFYKDMLYDITMLANSHTAQSLWLDDLCRRKEAICVD